MSDETRNSLNRMREEVSKAVVGSGSAVTAVVICLLTGGHLLLEGVPGTGKTLLVRALSKALQADSARIQFTPDLMPADITGSSIFNAETRQFEFRTGPVFTDLLLADEINRTPPKTQSALLEAMSDRSVTADGQTHQLSPLFTVLATQNPIEQEGTYQLPEAQLDRFLMKLSVGYTSAEDEARIVAAHAAGFNPADLSQLQPVTSPQELLAARAEVATLHVAPEVIRYAVELGRATRNHPAAQLGVSPRGHIALVYAARAMAWLKGQPYVSPEDIKQMAHATLAHRIILRPEAALEGTDTRSVIDAALANVPAPR